MDDIGQYESNEIWWNMDHVMSIWQTEPFFMVMMQSKKYLRVVVFFTVIHEKPNKPKNNLTCIFANSLPETATYKVFIICKAVEKKCDPL